MARNQTVTATVQNMFALNRVRKECYYEPIRVDFSPIQKPNNVSEGIIPFFNKDGNYFTPAFILHRQKSTLIENLQSEKNKFEARISHSQKPIEDETPQYKPTDSKYCQLCNEYFADYWEHINAKYHKRMINSSKFNRDILALCESFEKQDRSKNAPKTKKIEKKKMDPKFNKQIDSKGQDKEIKQQMQNQGIQSQKCHQCRCNKSQNIQIENKEINNVEESLKITLQLGNYSTNLLSHNTFKQLCRES